MSDNNGPNVRLTFAGQPRTVSEGVKAESGKLGNNSKQVDGPFIFPRKPRTGWKRSASRVILHK